MCGPFHGLQGTYHFFRYLRQQLQNLDGAFLEASRTAFDVHVDVVGILDELHAGNRERIALQELQHPKALQSFADGVVRAVGRGDVSQHVGRRADPVQVVGARVFDFKLALQQDTQRALQTRGLLGGRPRTLATHRERNHHAGEQHDFAHRQDDQRVFGHGTRCGLPRWLFRGRRSFDAHAGVGGDWIAF